MVSRSDLSLGEEIATGIPAGLRVGLTRLVGRVIKRTRKVHKKEPFGSLCNSKASEEGTNGELGGEGVRSLIVGRT